MTIDVWCRNELIFKFKNDNIQFDNALNLLSEWDKFNENITNEILQKYPKLKLIEKNLQIDWYSNFENMKHHFDDLNLLSNSVIKKIRDMKPIPYIYITDRPPASARDINCLWTPRWYPPWSTWDNVEGFQYDGDIYVGRRKIDWEYKYNGCSHVLLHELWHLFDEKKDSDWYWYYQWYWYSQSLEFKELHRKFYNKLDPYYQQWWPWWFAWCSEFFAECSSLFFYETKNTFVRLYDENLYNYMKKCLE